MELFEKIKKFRKEKGLSQEALSEKLGVHKAHLSRLENGKYQPSLEVIKKLAKAFEISIDDLLSDEEEISEVRINNKSLAEKLRLIDSLDEEDKQAIIKVIDSMLTKKKMVDLLTKEKTAS